MAEEKIPTGTELLIEAMELLGESDKQDVIVIIRDSNGNFIWRSNMQSVIERLGMLHFAVLRQEYLVQASDK